MIDRDHKDRGQLLMMSCHLRVAAEILKQKEKEKKKKQVEAAQWSVSVRLNCQSWGLKPSLKKWHASPSKFEVEGEVGAATNLVVSEGRRW